MAFKLTKEERDALFEARKKTNEVWEEFVKGAEDLELARQRYLDSRQKTIDTVNDIASRMRGEFADKSEKWQESDAGQEAEEFINTWESFENGVDDVDEIEIPGSDPLEDELENLPEEQGL
jgi:hypothetical protein